MKVIKDTDVERIEAPKENFIGQGYLQWVINDEKVSKQLQIAIVTFTPGARTKDHIHHTSDQVLYVLEGRGILSSDGSEEVVGPGTIIHIPMGERHWHGTRKDTSFTHISILIPGKTTHYD
ncbi:cupin domain-containing protein [Chloroflexota bacterium]